WVPPSPNMPSVRTALVYPGGCLIEGTNLSEGRGTTLPFELVGAPWLDPHAVAAGLDSERLAGVLSRPATFRPMFHKHAGIACHGVQLIVTRAEAFEPFLTYLALIRVVRRLDRRFAWRSAPYEFESERPAIDHLLGVTGLRERLESDEPLERLRSGWEPALDRFAESRRRYLLYD
ncbi:MAG TPA: hypothetical protein VD788_12630, partial [Candidatus Polarisedimenticolaceae bacterium]|nr:hypothetical protein [Candidatus Polarisedimenticolaceae bacterium]